MPDPLVKQQVREFYDQVGWQVTGQQGLYQNASYEDLRPVSQEYIRRCHLRVKRFLPARGRFLLDAGSGPIQYPEYLTYSQGYQYRVCADISIVALQEARKRIGSHGLFVVADVANLPFKPGAFDGAVSLHTLHHIPAEEQVKAYGEVYRVMAPGSSAVVVNGWTSSRLMHRLDGLVRAMESLQRRFRPRAGSQQVDPQPAGPQGAAPERPAGTFVHKINAAWLEQAFSGRMDLEIRCWRSVSVRFLRAVVHASLAGRLWLRCLYALEDRFPRFMGVNGQYPLIVIRKP